MSYTPSVPPEFVGLARAFRARVGAEDDEVGQTIQRLVKPLTARRKRSATFRPETLIDVERQYRMLPSTGRLTLKVERDRKGLLIEEYRCAAGEFRFRAWNSDATDPDIGVVRITLVARHWQPVGFAGNIICSVSLHALARRFQRGFVTTDEAISSELRQIALRYNEIVESMGDFSVAGDGGRWVGGVVRTEVEGTWEPTLTLRSFTPFGAPVRGTAFAAVAAPLG